MVAPNGQRHRVQCPKPFPPRGIFVFTPSVVQAFGTNAAQFMMVAPPMTVQVPKGIGAGCQFEVTGPDGHRYKATVPTPFPNKGVFVYHPQPHDKIDMTPLEAPFKVQVPKGVGAGQSFTVRSPGGLNCSVQCPKPFPRGGTFMYTPIAMDLR